jgi:Fe-S cluster biosynthesis and repair protein YggX
MVKCVKLQRELPGLESPPWPGELGRRVYDNVSADAWKMWQKEAQELVARHMEDFFFGEGAALPPGYVPEKSKG